MPQGLWGWRSGERPPGAAAPQPSAPPSGSRLRGRASPPHQRPPAQGVARPSPAATGATGRQRSALLTPAWPLPAQPLGPEMGGQAPAEMVLIHAVPSPRQAAIRLSPAGWPHTVGQRARARNKYTRVQACRTLSRYGMRHMGHSGVHWGDTDAGRPGFPTHRPCEGGRRRKARPAPSAVAPLAGAIGDRAQS